MEREAENVCYEEIRQLISNKDENGFTEYNGNKYDTGAGRFRVENCKIVFRPKAA